MRPTTGCGAMFEKPAGRPYFKHTSAGCAAAPLPTTTHCSAPHMQLSMSFPAAETDPEHVHDGGATSDAGCAWTGAERTARPVAAVMPANVPAKTASVHPR